MVDIPRSSFIPKEKSGIIPNRVQSRRTFGVFNFIATVMLVVSLIGAGGAYLYKNIASAAFGKAGQDLAEQKGLFKDDQITEVRFFDKRLRAATYLLKNHIAPSKILSALESTTKQRIQFTNFTLEYNPGLQVQLTLKGATQEFKTVALQSLEFGKEGSLLKDAVFKNVGTDGGKNGNASTPAKTGEANGSTTNNGVIFTVEGNVGQALLSYDGTDPGANSSNPLPQEHQIEPTSSVPDNVVTP